jgi:hypothetical protein
MSDEFARLEWPELPYAEWAETKRMVHLCTQMMGKAKLALSPTQPEWMHVGLFVTPRGLTTGPMPWSDRSVEIVLDVFDDALVVNVSDGRSARVLLATGRSVADVFADLSDTLAGLGVPYDVWDRPQEVADTVAFHDDRRPGEWDRAAIRKWFDLVTAVSNVFEEWRGRFFGRTGVRFWWGAFDIGVLRFTGRHAEAPNDKGYIMRYDLDAEFMNAGFWPGDEASPDPIFYAYLSPAPAGCDLAPVNPKAAAWIERMGEWVLPYEAVRTSGDPRAALLDFLDSVYAVAGTNGGWDLASFEYTTPAPSARNA